MTDLLSLLRFLRGLGRCSSSLSELEDDEELELDPAEPPRFLLRFLMLSLESELEEEDEEDDEEEERDRDLPSRNSAQVMFADDRPFFLLRTCFFFSWK